MKNKSILLFLLIAIMFIFSACAANKGDGHYNDGFPLEEAEYVFEECVYLVGWSAITSETMTQMKKGELALDCTNSSFYYQGVRINYNLDETSFALVDESKLNRSDIIMRFDVYNGSHFSGSTILIDKYEQAYIAYLGYFGTNTKYQFYEIWKISLSD